MSRAGLEKLAERLTALTPRGDEQAGLVSVAVGALWALISALKLDYSDSNDTQWVHAQKVARALSRGALPVTGKYLAGYHFNDALLRLDIAYENVLRCFTRRRGNEVAKTLITIAIEKGWDVRHFRSWNIVRGEVNALKHRNPEQIDRQKTKQTVPLDVALSAATNLVLLIERIVGNSPRSTPARDSLNIR